MPSMANKKDTGPQKRNKELPYIGFSDDTSALGESAEDLQQLVQIMSDVFEEFHLILNLDKTNTMVIKNQDSNETPSTIVSINKVPIQNITKFKILGAFLTQNPMANNMNEIGSKKVMTQKQFTKNRNILLNMKILLTIHIQISNTTIRPL